MAKTTIAKRLKVIIKRVGSCAVYILKCFVIHSYEYERRRIYSMASKIPM